MNRFLRILTVIFAVTVFATVSLACINDNETPVYEEEFRDEYQPATEDGSPVNWTLAFAGAGTTLLAGGLGLAFWPSRKS